MNTEIRNCMYRAYSVKFDLLYFLRIFQIFLMKSGKQNFFLRIKKLFL
jgi:hypothetical protein